jgi:hypothetical protein
MGIVDWFHITFSGKRVGILGPRNSGKTTLHTWLREGALPAEYRPTQQAVTTKKARPTLQGPDSTEKLALKQGRDVSGDAINDLAAWRTVIDESDVLVYLFDASLVLVNDEGQRRQIIRDCAMIGPRVADRRDNGRGPRIALVGTHCDLIDGYAADGSGQTRIAIHERVLAIEALKDARWSIQDALADDSPPTVIFGSLKEPETADDLSYRVFKQHFGL